MSLVIEPAKPHDEPEIQRLIRSVLAEFGLPYDTATAAELTGIEEQYRPPRSVFFVARMDGRIIGTTGVKEAGEGKAILKHQYVHADYRRKGIGAKLLDAALVYCRVLGYREVELDTAAWMQQAQRLYRSRGFRETGRDESGVHFRLALARSP
ncbi:MAG: GNAT family N-acetyltransferase [Armatimonadota bacterium]|nr:GNAT family N-acetyltransferase [Armatimonadota bacterium]MDR5697056.1 GNAT family N-acetyltransferase [Armatimonadota bacterium]